MWAAETQLGWHWLPEVACDRTLYCLLNTHQKHTPMQCSYYLPHQTTSLCGTSSSGCSLFMELWLCSPPWRIHREIERVGGESHSWHRAGEKKKKKSMATIWIAPRQQCCPTTLSHCSISPTSSWRWASSKRGAQVRGARLLASSGATHWGKTIHPKSRRIRPEILLICKCR